MIAGASNTLSFCGSMSHDGECTPQHIHASALPHLSMLFLRSFALGRSLTLVSCLLGAATPRLRDCHGCNSAGLLFVVVVVCLSFVVVL